ncbi:MAG: hypothetical protein II919_00505 [Lachnospiraceae bacterium]|nr:hypothetical protein [Lachnospiraceae bacterium]
MDNKKKDRLKNNQRMRIGIFVLLAVVTVVGGIMYQSYSKYARNASVDEVNELQEFYAAAKLYVRDGENLKEIPLSEKDGKRFFDVSIDDFNNTIMDITYQGKAKTYMRFKFDTSWYYKSYNDVTDKYEDVLILHQIPLLEYQDGLELFDNRIKDNWVYFKNVVEFDTEDENTIHVITKMTKREDFTDPNNIHDQSQFIRIYVVIDCVQFNRALDVWNMERFPWENE